MSDDRLTDAYGNDEWLANLERGRDRMGGWTFDTYPADHVARRRARDAVVAWYERGEPQPTPTGLYIHGRHGVAKTGLAYPLARSWIVDGCGGAVFEDVQDLLERQRARFDRGEPKAIDHLLDVDHDTLVVLDDLGRGRPTPFAVDTVSLIVARLHAARRRMVVTSNYAPSALARWLSHGDDPVVGERIVSRLLEDALVIPIDAPSVRPRATRTTATAGDEPTERGET